ncbi:MAG: bifunctional demethylmenaquinone methyltransferase/2-methoxy-6-polyprenyl-1,4-benzoquinol methylase UbiE [Vampirovibrionales bacterium]|nr:bifunctional demethylmenaquinone methyltransferase/2-methoxy-6-polyprenyl-1,4-benzoquinol methylase UbiE [Vampirovibrionales bacterium]
MTTPSYATHLEPQHVAALFNTIAPRYDLLNDVISFGMHRSWKRRACAMLNLAPGQPGQTVLDICTGTGDLAGELLRLVGPKGQVVGIDFSSQMLAVAQARFAGQPNVRFIQADALQLPFEPETFDGAIISFGLRNLASADAGLRAFARVLKPGAKLVCLDTVPGGGPPGFGFYFRHIMPKVGTLLGADHASYNYLNASTERFLPPPQLAELFTTCGFAQPQVKFTGFGAAAIVCGTRL